MNDTPQHIKEIQLKIWLSKKPGERLKQFLIDNEAFFRVIEEMKKNLQTGEKKNRNADDAD